MALNPDKIKGLVKQYLAFWDQVDIDGLMSMYDTRMQYHDMPSGEVIDYEHLQQFLSDTFAHESEQNLKLNESTFIEVNSAFIYWTQTFVSVHTGRKVTVKGVELIVFRAGKITSIHEFYDFQDTGAPPAAVPSAGTEQEKMLKLGLSEETVQQLAHELTVYFDSERPYLEPELTLSSVSDHLGYTRNQVSFVINRVLDRSFYDLVNERRIAHAVQKMSAPEQHLSILELGFDAGFNSVSGFYNAFKKQTGQSPAQYRRSLSS